MPKPSSQKKNKTNPPAEIETAIIVGRQGCGKTTFGLSLFTSSLPYIIAANAEREQKFYREPSGGKPPENARRISHSHAQELPDAETLEGVIGFIREKANGPAANAEPHILFIDEADAFFDLIATDGRETFRRYWAVARHAGLHRAIFVARRTVELPVFVRNSVTRHFVSSLTTEKNELELIQKTGGVFHFDTAAEIGDFQDVIENAKTPYLVNIHRVNCFREKMH